VELISPGSFRGPAELASQLADPAQRRLVLNYFSFVTLTTVGYGDIVPASPPARSLACVEAVVGQFYLAVLVAGLVGISVSGRRPSPPEP
jgi:hypothetical protein